MDLSKIAGSLLSSDSLKGLSNLTGASNKDITSVLTSALPSLLSGATEQAKNESTAASFAGALAQHAKDDTSDLTSFLGNVDLADGAKIIGHLLGSGKEETVKKAAKASGVSEKKTGDILSAIAPMLLSLLGQQAEEDDDKESGVNGLVGALLDNVDVGSLLSGLISTDTSSSASTSGKKKPASSKKNNASGIIGGILSGLLKKK
ncbi:MAG: DUF937 domain-containing protein [Lachnospiraceae bacterium]|nr:DUF937 domain-containing protein [Lachnospiraceae bacterium]MBO5325877.1 DUF937 domain-containing protein [Lachnospiraceae bacterium]MBP3578486.1 DUF937 domain-containing protein [Lachnospiraceae bacterium]